MSHSDPTYVSRAVRPSACARSPAAPVEIASLVLAAPLRPSPNTGVRPTYAYWGGENLYVNLTSRCSSACVFCLRESTWEMFGSDLYLGEDDEPTAADVIAALEAEMGRAPGATPAVVNDAADKVTARAPEQVVKRVTDGAVRGAADRAVGVARPREVVFTGLGEPTVRLECFLKWCGGSRRSAWHRASTPMGTHLSFTPTEPWWRSWSPRDWTESR